MFIISHYPRVHSSLTSAPSTATSTLSFAMLPPPQKPPNSYYRNEKIRSVSLQTRPSAILNYRLLTNRIIPLAKHVELLLPPFIPRRTSTKGRSYQYQNSRSSISIQRSAAHRPSTAIEKPNLIASGSQSALALKPELINASAMAPRQTHQAKHMEKLDRNTGNSVAPSSVHVYHLPPTAPRSQNLTSVGTPHLKQRPGHSTFFSLKLSLAHRPTTHHTLH